MIPFLFLIFTHLVSAHAEVESDSGVVNPPFETVQTTLSQLSRTFPKQAKVIEYGRTVRGRTLTLLKVSGQSKKKARAVQISGAIHGNEYLGIEIDLASHFLKNQKNLPGFTLLLASGGAVYFVPVVNPDGFSDRRRTNQNDKDLNRDWDIPPTGERRFTQPEIRSLTNYLEQDLNENQLQLGYSLDYHCCQGSMIMPWAYKNEYPKQDDLERFNVVGDLQKRILGFMVGNPADTVGYNAPGSSADYFYAKYGTLAFAVEGMRGGEQSRFLKHIALLDAVFKIMAEENFRSKN